MDCLQLQGRWQNGCPRQRDKNLTLGWGGARGMEARDGEETETVGRGNHKDSQKLRSV